MDDLFLYVAKQQAQAGASSTACSERNKVVVPEEPNVANAEPTAGSDRRDESTEGRSAIEGAIYKGVNPDGSPKWVDVSLIKALKLFDKDFEANFESGKYFQTLAPAPLPKEEDKPITGGIPVDEASPREEEVKEAEQSLLLREGESDSLESKEFFNWSMTLAKNGDAHAQYDLSRLFARGHSVCKNDIEAADWCRKAAAQGHAEAQHLLAVFYDDGTGVKKDVALAVEWYRKAAENGNRVSQFILGMMYDKAWRIYQDKAESAKWYLRAARQGLAPAQFAFGCCCLTGCGVEKSTWLALHWFRLAAEQGYTSAQYNMGHFLSEEASKRGDSDPLAIEWFNRAAEEGDVSASIALAKYYQKLPGIENKRIAFHWLAQTARQGNFDVMHFLEYVCKLPVNFFYEQPTCTDWLDKLTRAQVSTMNDCLPRLISLAGLEEGPRYTLRISEWYKGWAALDIPLPKNLLEFDYGEDFSKCFPVSQRQEEDIIKGFFWSAADLDKEVSGGRSKKHFFGTMHGDNIMKLSEECYENVRLHDWHYALRVAYEWIDGDTLWAQELCEKALALNPEHFAALNYKACFLLEAGKLTESLALLQKVTGMRSDFPLAWKNLGVVLGRCGRHEEAISAYDQAFKLNTYYVMALFLKGNLLLRHRRYLEAMEAYKLVCDNDKEVDSQVGLDAMFEEFSGAHVGEDASWNQCYAKAVRLKQQEAFAWAMEQAKESLMIALDKFGEQHPDTAASLNLIGELFYCYYKYPIGVRWVRRALAMRVRTMGPNHPEVAESLHNIALFEREQMRNNKAVVRLSQQTLIIRVKAYGLRHPKVAYNLNTLKVLNIENTETNEEARCYAKFGLAVCEAVKGECSWSDSVCDKLREFLTDKPLESEETRERDEREVKSAAEWEEIKPVLQAFNDKYRAIRKKERTPEAGAELLALLEDAGRQIDPKWLLRIFSNGDWPSTTIFLRNLPSLPPPVAYALAKWDMHGNIQLYFAEHGMLDKVSAAFLSKCIGPLHIHGLKSLSPESLAHLKQYQGTRLTVNSAILYEALRTDYPLEQEES